MEQEVYKNIIRGFFFIKCLFHSFWREQVSYYHYTLDWLHNLQDPEKNKNEVLFILKAGQKCLYNASQEKNLNSTYHQIRTFSENLSNKDEQWSLIQGKTEPSRKGTASSLGPERLRPLLPVSQGSRAPGHLRAFAGQTRPVRLKHSLVDLIRTSPEK